MNGPTVAVCEEDHNLSIRKHCVVSTLIFVIRVNVICLPLKISMMIYNN